MQLAAHLARVSALPKDVNSHLTFGSLTRGTVINTLIVQQEDNGL
jgi:hypothetical protein